MLKNIKNTIEYIRNVGVHPELSPEIVEKIRTTNSMVLIGICINSFFLFLGIFVYQTPQRVVISIGTMSLILGITILFNTLKNKQLASYFLIIALTILFTYLKIIYANNWGEQFMFLIIISLVFLLFSDNRKQLVLVLVIVFFFMLAKFIHVSFFSDTISRFTSSEDSRVYMFIIYVLMLGFVLNLNKKRFIKESDRQNELLQALQDKNKEIQQVSKEVERFNHIASHDLKSPLRNIVSFIGLIKIKLKQKQYKDISEQLSFAENAGEQMHLLIDDILAFSNLSQPNDVMSNININDLIKDTIEHLSDFLKANDAQIEHNQLPIINANYEALKMVFQNLIKNGIQYNNSTQPIVKIVYSATNDQHIFEIKDNGIGVSKEFQSQIFEYFKRLHTYQAHQGTGLGLGICKKIIQKMGGELSLTSEEEKGSVFMVKLPL